MKTFFSYILFLALAIRPLYNVGCYAYYELNIDYIIDTYCVNKEKPEFKCNGKCHLATQLGTITQDIEGNTTFINTIFKTFIPVYFQKQTTDLTFYFQNERFQNNWSNSKMLISTYQENLDRPPQV